MNKYTKERPLRVFESFAGYGSQSMALQRIAERHPDFHYEVVGFSEIDPPAIKAYHMVHGDDIPNYGDISKVDWSQVPDFDFFTVSSPCQDFSAAGLRKGGEEGSGTRSSLLWECRKAILAKHPKYLFFENVSNLVGKKFLPLFLKWVHELEGYGYKNFLPPVFPTPWKEKRKQTRKYIMDASDYGVPQHRERVYMISILRTENDPDPQYSFPAPFPLERHLIDVLEEGVDERYFISDKMLKYFRSVDEDKSHGHDFKPKKKATP